MGSKSMEIDGKSVVLLKKKKISQYYWSELIDISYPCMLNFFFVGIYEVPWQALGGRF